MEEPDWQTVWSHPGDRLSEHYFITASPKQRDKKASLVEVDPKAARNLRQAGNPLSEQKRTQQRGCRLLFLTVFRLPPPPRKTGGSTEWVLLISGVKDHP